MKDSPFQCPDKTVLRQKTEKQDQGTDALHAEASEEHHPLQPDNAVDISHAESLGHDESLLQADTAAQEKHHHGSRGHKAQAADLNQTQQYNLTEAAPLAPGVKERQPRDAGGGGGGKESRKESGGNSVSGGGGQIQKQGSRQDNQPEGHGNDLGGTQVLGSSLHPEPV